MNYGGAQKAMKADNPFDSCKIGKPRTGRGMLPYDILKDPFWGWYMNLPDDYYKSK